MALGRVEVFDPQNKACCSRLAVWICGELEAASVELNKAVKLTGGAIQENWLCDFVLTGGSREGHHQWVLRTDAVSSLQTSHSRAEEYQILQLVHKRGVKVPGTVACCTDSSILGTEFYLMEYVEGVAQARLITRDPALAEFGDQLAVSLGKELAMIHSIKPLPATLEFLKIPENAPAEARIKTYREYLDSLPRNSPALELALVWLEDNMSKEYEVVLGQSDFRTGNYLVHRQKLGAILDWEFSSWADPMEDIGWFTARCWRFGNDHLEAGGIGKLNSFLDGYESITQVPVNRSGILYWQVMAEVRWGVIAMQQEERHKSGEEVSLELALTGRMVAEMEHSALQLVQGQCSSHSINQPDQALGTNNAQPSSGQKTELWLVAAIDELESRVMPELTGRARYSCAMIKRMLEIVRREQAADLAQSESNMLQQVYGNSTESSTEKLAQDIRQRRLGLSAGLVDTVRVQIEAQLAVDNPTFLRARQTHGDAA